MTSAVQIDRAVVVGDAPQRQISAAPVNRAAVVVGDPAPEVKASRAAIEIERAAIVEGVYCEVAALPRDGSIRLAIAHGQRAGGDEDAATIFGIAHAQRAGGDEDAAIIFGLPCRDVSAADGEVATHLQVVDIP